MPKCSNHGRGIGVWFFTPCSKLVPCCQGMWSSLKAMYVIVPSVTEAALSKLAAFSILLWFYKPEYSLIQPPISLYWSKKWVANRAASLVMSWRAKKIKSCLGDCHHVSGDGSWKPGWARTHHISLRRIFQIFRVEISVSCTDRWKAGGGGPPPRPLPE